jgi:hypothetical protein
MLGMNDDFPLMMEVEAGTPANTPPVGVAFGLWPRLDKKATQEAGHDVYRDCEYVRISIPGDRSTLYFQPATDMDRKRFPKAYAVFKGSGKEALQGMPIEQWPVVSRSLAMTLRACNIRTVEALAAVHDGHVDKLGFNARELREKARAWLAQAKDGAAATALAAEKKALQDQLAAMQAQLTALSASMTPEQRAAVAKSQAQVVAPVAIDAPADDVEQDVAAAARRPRARKVA